MGLDVFAQHALVGAFDPQRGDAVVGQSLQHRGRKSLMLLAVQHHLRWAVQVEIELKLGFALQQIERHGDEVARDAILGKSSHLRHPLQSCV